MKAPLYARSGVREFWIVDLPGRAVDVFRNPAADGYRVNERMTTGAVSPVAVPDVTLDVAALFA